MGLPQGHRFAVVNTIKPHPMPYANGRPIAESVKRPTTDHWTWDSYSLNALRPDEARETNLWRRYFASVPGSAEARQLMDRLKGART